MSVPYETHENINITGRPASVTLHRGSRSNAAVGQHAGRVRASPAHRFCSHPRNLLFLASKYTGGNGLRAIKHLDKLLVIFISFKLEGSYQSILNHLKAVTQLKHRIRSRISSQIYKP